MTIASPARIGIVEDDEPLRAYMESIVEAAARLVLAFSANFVWSHSRCFLSARIWNGRPILI